MLKKRHSGPNLLISGEIQLYRGVQGDFMESNLCGKGQGTVNRFMGVFTDFVDRFDLVDLPMGGNEFIWSKGNLNSSLSKIDWFLISAEQEELFLHSIGYVLLRPISDRCSILLDCRKVVGRPRTFWFEMIWLEDESLMPLLKKWWENMDYEGGSYLWEFCGDLWHSM